jgi:hypothetical protein
LPARFAVDGAALIRYHLITGHPLFIYFFLSGIIAAMTSLPHPIVQAPQEQNAANGERPVPLPTVPPATGSAGPNRGRVRNAVLTILVLTLAFLAASFLARNSDLWFHLATGRLLARGEFTFGADPFAYTTQQVYWACHSWLFDLALYGLRGLIGEAGLVVLKALLVTGLAGLLLRIRRPGGALWLPAACTTLAILAMSPRLLLQPACVSYFLLGLTFWLLWRQQQRAGSVSDGKMSDAYASVLLLFVFILWVNVDEWFFLGPLLAALFWLGERLGGQRRTPGWLAPVGLAVCLLNPYTYHAFTLPAELSIVPWTSGLRQDARFRTVFASPWEAEYFHAAWRLNAAVLAYYALTLLGLVSFLLHRPALRDWRLFVWLPFALLAAWQARLIPFFAIVAAPITALNWQDIISARSEARSMRSRLVPGTLYLALLLVLLSLNVLAWMGWLAGYDREERHVAWGFQEDPSLREAAETLGSWRGHDLLPGSERVFALAPEVAHYCAWFCPGEKQFFDHRYPLFSHAARDYETVCSALLPSPGHDAADSKEQRTAEWQQVLREHKIGIVVFYDRDWQRLFPVLNRLSNDDKNWTLLHVAGQALIAGWNQARPSWSFASLAFDPERLAFGPEEAKSPSRAPRAPDRGPAQLSQRRDWRERLVRAPAVPAWESAAATTYLYYFQNNEVVQQERQKFVSLSGFAASLSGLPAQPPALIQTAAQVFSARKLLFPDDTGPQFREDLGPFFASLVERPPALPLLAIRAARRAVAANPQDATAWLRLGQAYLFLRNLTCERSAEGVLPPLAQLRHVQIATALEQAVRIDPDLEVAHHELAFLYGGSNSLDQALEHRREELRLSRRAGPLPGESAKEFAYRLEYLDKDTAKLVELVEDNRKKFASASRSFQGDRIAQARLALRLGLTRQAVDEILLTTPADVLGAAGIRLELDLLISLGRAQEVRDILSDRGLRASKHGLGYADLPPPADRDNVRLYGAPYHWPAYEWLHVLESAAVGDYALCQNDLRAIRDSQQILQDQRQQQAGKFQNSVRMLLPSLMTGSNPYLPAFIALTLAHAMEEKSGLDANLQTLRAQQADLCVLEGLLALEQGDVDAAGSAFIEAQKLGAELPFAGKAVAACYLGKLMR